jgi:hypothetical protein
MLPNGSPNQFRFGPGSFLSRLLASTNAAKEKNAANLWVIDNPELAATYPVGH